MIFHKNGWQYHMKVRQIKPNAWSCSITALAMTLDIPVSEVITEIGHDGSEIIFPNMDEPMRRRGFHSQELVEIAWHHGYAMTPIEFFPRLRANNGSETVHIWGESFSTVRFFGAIEGSLGILEGNGRKCQHAVHNFYGNLYDPDPSGSVYKVDDHKKHDFYPTRLWVFTRRSV